MSVETRAGYLGVIANRRADNLKLWLELMGIIDKVELIKLAMLTDGVKANRILRQISDNDADVVEATRGLIDDH